MLLQDEKKVKGRKIKTQLKPNNKKVERQANQMQREWLQVLSHLKQELENLADAPALRGSLSLSGSLCAVLGYRRCFTDD